MVKKSNKTKIPQNYHTLGNCCYACVHSDWTVDDVTKLRLECKEAGIFVDPHGLCLDFEAEEWHLDDMGRI